jgi:uncharacterized membrane protein YqjE
MHTRADGGVGSVVQQVADHARSLVRLEVELASLELRQKAAALGGGFALIVSAVVLTLFAVGFLLATIAAVIAIFLPLWTATLVVGVMLLLLAAGLAFAARSLLQRASPPIPEQALLEARRAREALGRRNGA